MKEVILGQLSDEIEKLQHELNVELPKEIGKARELGDLSENAEYHAAKERQHYLRSRMEQLRQRFQQLSLLDFSKIPRDKIGLGSAVKVLDLDTDGEITYTLVIAEEADVASGKISVSSPIGRALLGKVDGDEVRVVVPSGVREFEILSFKTVYDALKKNK
jgi:transcription elongation factor GreA